MNMKVKGQCLGCKEMFPAAKGGQHLSAYSKISQVLQESPSSASGYLLKVSSAEAPAILWMFLTVPSNATLHFLDQFLRKTWLECCGHMSMFTIDRKRYSSSQMNQTGDSLGSPFSVVDKCALRGFLKTVSMSKSFFTCFSYLRFFLWNETE